MAEMSQAEIAQRIINKVVDNIVNRVNDEEEYAEKNSDMNDPYYMGYTDALVYIAGVINSQKSEEK